MLGHQVVLMVGLIALAGTAWSLARRHCDGAVETLLAAAAYAGGGAVLWTLVLGLGGWAGHATVLALGPVLALLGLGAWDRVTGRHRRATGIGGPDARPLDGPERVARAAALGLLAGTVLEVALQPGFGVDAVAYHLPTALGWLRSGHAGRAQLLTYDFPVGYYPLSTEVLLTWLLGMSRTFAPMAAVGPFTAALGGLGLWQLLRCAGVPRGPCWLAGAVFLTLPQVLFGVDATGPGTDLSAVSWLLCGAALAAGAGPSRAAPLVGAATGPSRVAPPVDAAPGPTHGGPPDVAAGGRPLLLAPAMVACGLGVGTKTTVAPLVLVVLAVALWRVRPALRRAVAPLGVAVLVALAVSLPWYLRNLIVHGWPLWPFSQGPVGDRLPHTMQLFSASFLSRPRVTFEHSPGLYLENAGGGVVLILAAGLAPLLLRRRAILAASAVALLAVLAWAQAPFTGLSTDPLLDGLAITTVRYLLSALCACLFAVALLTRPQAPQPVRVTATLLMLAAIVGSLVADGRLGFPAVPRPGWPLLGGLLGAAGAAAPLLLGRVRRPRVRSAALDPPADAEPAVRRRRLSRRSPASARPAVLTLAVLGFGTLALGLVAPGWVAREADHEGADASLTAFMLRQPGYASSPRPVAFAPAEIATLAGPRFTHPLELIPARESCARTRARLRSQWVVVAPSLQGQGILPRFNAAACLAGLTPRFSDGTTLVYGAAPRRGGL